MNNIIPLFKTHASIGRSLLVSDYQEDIKDDAPVSVIAIGKKFRLSNISIAENSFSSFIEVMRACDKVNIQLNFGVNFLLCENVLNKDEESIKTENKITVWMKNSNGYKDLLKLYGAIKANKENFYYEPRGDWNIVKSFWTDNLLLSFPPYDNFIHKNLLENGKCVPDFGFIKPIFFYSDMNLAFDQVLIPAIKDYCRINRIPTQEAHPIYYYKKEDSLAYQVLRCIDSKGGSKRATIETPGLNHMSSDSFCWENYCEKTGLEFVK